MGEPSGHLFEEDLHLQAGQGGAQARMSADTEGQVPSGVAAVNVELVGLGEDVVVSVSDVERDSLLERANAVSVPAVVIGKTGGDRIRVTVCGAVVADIGLDEAERSWANGLTQHFEQVVG